MIVVLLVSVVALGAIVAAMSVAALSSRQVTEFESAATVALMAAESGHNTLLARADLPGYAYDPAEHTSIAAWLNASLAGDFSFSDYDLPGGARVQLSALGDDATGVITIRSVGIAPDNSARRVLLRDYLVAFGTDVITRYSEAALITKTGLMSKSAPSAIRGLSHRYGDWVFEGALSSARSGEYVVFDGEKSGYSFDGGVTYRVHVDDDDMDSRGRPLAMDLVRVTEGDDVSPMDYPDSVRCAFNSDGSVTGGDDLCFSDTMLVPFAVSATQEELQLVDGVFRLPVNLSALEAFSKGDPVHFGDDEPNGLSAVITEVGDGYLEFDAVNGAWNGKEILEGTPIRGRVLSAIAEGGCDVDESRDTPEGCDDEDIDLGNLFRNTFGTSKTLLRAVAMTGDDDAKLDDLAWDPARPDEPGLSTAQIDHWKGVNRAHYGGGRDWPASVSGLTWVDSAATRGANNRLCGSGIVILNTGADVDETGRDINLTTQDCEFRGVLYIVGQAKLVGNLSHFQGTVYVEGPGGITEMQGTGRGGMAGKDDNPKSLYNAIAVRDAFGLLPADEGVAGVFAELDRTLRLGTVGTP